MSFIQDFTGALVKDLMPSNLLPLVDPTRKDNLEAWQIVPYEDAKLFEWAYVVKRQTIYDRSRRYMLLYKYPAGISGVVYPVIVRVQGILGRFDIGTLGSWNGHPDSAASSIQFVNLLPAGDAEPWLSTLNTIRSIRQMIHNCLEGANPFVEPPMRAAKPLYLQRRIFKKVTDGTPASALTAGDDPHEWAPGVDNMWRVTQKLETGQREGSGTNSICSPFLFSQGDFVDIGVAFDIATTRQPSGRLRNHVHLSIVHVLQLCASKSPAQVDYSVKDRAQPQATDQVLPQIVHNSGLTFGSKAADDVDIEM